MDVHTKKVRSHNMSRVRCSNSKPEIIVRNHLWHHGFRYRKNDKRLPGCPDIVLPKYKTVVFVNGCFWHLHENCKKFSWPKTNESFWKEKLEGNKKRDNKNYLSLKEQDWKVIIIWECEIKNQQARSERLALLINEILSEQ